MRRVTVDRRDGRQYEPIGGERSGVSDLRFQHVGFGADAVDYRRGWQLQRAVHAQRVADEVDDTVLLLEHASVYTAGRRTDPADHPVDGTPVVEVDRGGKITWHGPGQLVGYPITALPDHVYVVDYIRRLEEALIRVCADVGVTAGRVAGRSGVWVPAGSGNPAGQAGLNDPAPVGRPDRKVAALGVRVSQGVTMHGLAINCDCDLTAFDAIVPCGIRDAGVTTLSVETGRDVTVAEVLPLVERHLTDLLSWRPYERSPVLPQPVTARAQTPVVRYGLQRLG